MENKKVIIVGLGNPGKKYEQNRHNIGFMILDQLCNSLSGKFNTNSNYSFTRVSHNDCTLYLLKPMEYMNLSGNAVLDILRKNTIKPDKILVIHDEIDFEFARIKLKFGGGHAGHNGLRDIIDKIGTKDFHRLRIGVGRPDDKDLVADYVLSNFFLEQKQKLPEIYKQSESLIFLWLKGLSFEK